jgi:hypothetical protein
MTTDTGSEVQCAGRTISRLKPVRSITPRSASPGRTPAPTQLFHASFCQRQCQVLSGSSCALYTNYVSLRAAQPALRQRHDQRLAYFSRHRHRWAVLPPVDRIATVTTQRARPTCWLGTNTGNEPSFISDALGCPATCSCPRTRPRSTQRAVQCKRTGTSPALKVLAKAAYITNNYRRQIRHLHGWRSQQQRMALDGLRGMQPEQLVPLRRNRTGFVFVFMRLRRSRTPTRSR